MEEGNCVICYKNCAADEEKISNSKISDAGYEDCNDLKNQLPIIFLLRKFLGIPQDTCSKILQEHGNPNMWINWCTHCSLLIENAKDAFNRIKLLQKQLETMRLEVINTIVKSDNERSPSHGPHSAKRPKKDNKSPTEIVRAYIIEEYDRPPTLTVEVKTENLNFDEEIPFSEADLMDFSLDTDTEHQHLNNFNINLDFDAAQNTEHNDVRNSSLSHNMPSESTGTGGLPALMKKLISQNKKLLDNVTQLSSKVNGLQDRNDEIVYLLSEEREKPNRRIGPASKTRNAIGEPCRTFVQPIRPPRKPLTTACIGDTMINIFIPENLECTLRATTKRSKMVSNLLRHFHSVKFLRSCTLTGASKKKSSDDPTTNLALPTRTLESIVAVVRKLSPSKLLAVLPENSAEYKMAEKTDIGEIRALITKSLQYFKSEYNDDGSIERRQKH